MAASKYLLDTHCLLWFQGNEARIPARIMDIIQDNANAILFSQVSLYEIAIKQAIGKLPDFQSDIDEVYHQALRDKFTFLTIQNHHLYSYRRVPLFEEHRDPFDRLILATAYEENAVILSADKNFKLYKGFVEVLW